ncbi:RecQ family ATP-dependent DNA helicase [Candidatus Poriferisodalis sp.]|uniref:RecQ family ATP-dependent DNA helicase n=1 Tax=Candidatus Poriferisodalis sp. TaxID=3101277 RepID=UPI003B0294A9
MREYVVFDLEANADRSDPPAHEIIEIGAVLVVDGVESGEFATLVRSTRPLRSQTRELTGLTDEDLTQAPTLIEALQRFATFTGDRPLMAHNGFGYDFPLMDAASAQSELPAIGGRRLDTLELAHLAFPRAGREMARGSDGSRPLVGRSLDDLAERLLGRSARPAHRALGDARLLADVLPPLIAILNESTPPRRLQRWVLHATAHPWSAFVHAELDPPSLASTIPVSVPRRRPAPTGTFDTDAVAGMLDSGGALMSHGRSPRAQQVEMARIVAMALANGGRRLIEAPTGTGKTFAYLLPAIEYARASGVTVALAPHSKVLQDQIAQSLEELSEHLAPFNSVLLKGRSNYIDVAALESKLLELDMQDDHFGDAQDAVAVGTSPSGHDSDHGAGSPRAVRGLALAVLSGWVSQTPTGDWDDLNTWALGSGFRSVMSSLRFVLSVSERPGPAKTDLDERCFYRRARDGLRHADVAVLNHALVINDDEWLDHAKHLVLDEAHNLEDSATDALTAEIGENEVDQLCDAIAPSGRGGGTVGRLARAARWSVRAAPLTDLRRCVSAVRDQLPRFGSALSAYLRVRTAASADDRYPSSYRIRRGFDTAHSDYYAVLREGRSLAEALEGIAGELNEINLPEQLEGRYQRDRLEAEMRHLGRFARNAAKTLRRVIHADAGAAGLSGPQASGTTGGDAMHSASLVASLAEQQRIAVGQIEHVDGRWIWLLRHVPLSVAPQLRQLWNGLEATVATSATLQVGGSFSHILNSLGLGAAQATALPTPFEALSEQHLLILADWLPAPRARLIDEFTEAAGRETGRLMLLAGGRAMALFTARSRMASARDKLRGYLDEHGVPLLAQGDEPAPALVARMRTEMATSLLALRSFWEGVDIPGEALSLLLLEKIPFDSPADPISGARMDALEDQGKDGFADYAVPRAALRMAQGAGRLIRAADDRGVTVMLDNRLCRATSYADQILSTLPGPPAQHRVRDPRDAYELICGHLHGIELTDELLNAMDAVPVDDTLAKIRALALDEDQARDARTVEQRLNRVREIFGFEHWRPGQLETMRRFMAGEDALSVLPTGSGKSITYQIPALLMPGVTLVLSPLISLMNDQVENLRRRGITEVAAIHSGVGQSEWRDILRGARRGDYRLLYISPERLWSQEFISLLSNVDVARIAIDEAHCISQWGHTFRPEYARIPEAIELLGGTPTNRRRVLRGRASPAGERPVLLAVTATANARVRADIMASLNLRIREPTVLSPDRPEISYHTEDCANRSDRDVRIAQVVEAFRRQASVVYVPTRRDAERVSGLLRIAGHAVRAYHAGMETAARSHVEDAFRHGEIDVVVATKAFGMGIDKPDIALIVHSEMPATIEEYVQETGRAARGAGQPGMPTDGTAVLLRMPEDCSIHQIFVRSAAPSVEQVRSIWAKLIPGVGSYVPEDLVADPDDATRESDAESVATSLAVHYLALAGMLKRHPDTPWEGRVTIIGDTRKRLSELHSGSASSDVDTPGADRVVGLQGDAAVEPEFVARAQRLIELAEQHDGRYNARRWSRDLGRSEVEVAQDLLELHHRDVIGFTVWKYGWVLERSPGEPDWADVERQCEQRRSEVAEKSDRAKAFARDRRSCRVAALLGYLDAPAAPGQSAGEGCGRCDACVDLPRPWATSHLTSAGLRAALPVARIILTLLADIEGARYSRTNIERCLVGDLHGHRPTPGRGQPGREDVETSRRPAVPQHLARHPSAGRLAFVGARNLRASVDELIVEGLIDVIEDDFDGTGARFERLELTDDGREAIGVGESS